MRSFAKAEVDAEDAKDAKDAKDTQDAEEAESTEGCNGREDKSRGLAVFSGSYLASKASRLSQERPH